MIRLLAIAAVLLAAAPAAAFDWNPEHYACPRAAEAPTIDGRLDEPAWQTAPWTGDFVDIEGDRRPVAPRFRTRARLLWDDQALYIAAQLDEPHVWGSLTRRDAVIFYDNDFEVFIDPDGDHHLYGELEINALGTVWDLLLVKPYRDGGPALNGWRLEGLQTAVHVDGTLNDPSDEDTGWTVEMAIPWSALKDIARDRACPPEPGDVWRLNLSRVQWEHRLEDGQYVRAPVAGRGWKGEDNWVWSAQGAVAMHQPETWGLVTFTSGDKAVTDPRDALRPVYELLMPVYHAQAAREAGYATRLADLELPAAVRGRLVARGARMTVSEAGWRLTVPVHGRAWTIDHEGRLRRAP